MLPNGIFKLSKLTYLNIAHPSIETIPKKITKLKQLKIIIIFPGYLSKLSVYLFKMQHLIVFHYTNNMQQVSLFKVFICLKIKFALMF